MRKKNLNFAIATMFLMTLIVVMMALTVRGEEKPEGAYAEGYYDRLETEYRQQVQGVLKENALYESGINLTKVTYADDTREYSLLIHNRRIAGLSDEEQELLMNQLEELIFPDGNCKVHVSFSF